MKKFLPLVLGIFAFLLIASSGYAANVLSVGTNAVVYKAGDNVTISGYVHTTASRPVGGATLNLVVAGPASFSDSTASGADGNFSFDPFTVSTAGTYAVTVVQPAEPGTYVSSYFTVEDVKKIYTVTTDKFTYTPSENVLITVTVKNEAGDPMSGVAIPIKVKMENGTLMTSATATSNTNGTATLTYNVSAYGKYVVTVGNSLAVTKFEVPAFKVKLDTLTTEGKSKHIFSSEESLILKVVTIIESDGNPLPVTGAGALANIKDSAGNTKATLSTFTESEDGVYYSDSYPLANLTNGKYYMDVEVTKGDFTQKARTDFEVQSYRVDLIPISGMEHTFGFLNGSDAKLGIIIEDLKTGEEFPADKILNATITECRTSEWQSCTVPASQLQAGFWEFARVLSFTAPVDVGEYFLSAQIEISTTTGAVNVTGHTWISVQPIIAFVHTKDLFDSWRWRYGPGETVVLEVKAIGGNWEDKTSEISSITLEEVRDDDWNDITSNITDVSYSGNNVQFSAPRTSGWYHARLKLSMSDGAIAYAGAGFGVSLYDIWAETKDESGNWEWRFGSDSDVFLHINVRKMDGSILPVSEIAKVSVNAIRNEITGKRYTNLQVEDNGTATNWENKEVPVKKLKLSGMGLTSGFYGVEIEVTDVKGNKEWGGTGFKVSSLDVWVDTKKASGEWAWQFAPTDNITFNVNAHYFNGTPVPDGSNVSITKLLSMREGPPVPISSDKYDTSGTVTTSGGQASLWLKATGDPLPEGHYMALVEVVVGNTTEVAEGWFDIRLLRVEVSFEQWSFAQSQDVTIGVTVRTTANDPISGANITLASLRDSMTWRELKLSDLGISASNLTGADGRADLSFPAQNLSVGEYEARLEISSDNPKSDSEAFAWFAIQNYQISGWFITDPGRQWGVYAPEEDVVMQIKVLHPNSTWSQEYAVSGAAVSVYKLLNTEGWPWTSKNVTTISTSETAMPGVYQVTFKSPSDTGRYNPLVNVSGDLSKTPWALPSFEVRDLGVSVLMYKQGDSNERDEFTPGDTILTTINVYNPTGGQLPTISEIALDSYEDLSTGARTTLGAKLTSNIGESNNLTFTAPSEEGEYVLTTSVKLTGNTIYAYKWFRVSAFDVHFWTERWAYSPGDNVTVYIEAKDTAGNAADVNVSTIGLKDVWTGTSLPFDENKQQISGSGTYNATAPSDIGEYDVRLCIYSGADGGTDCENGKEAHIHFSVESFWIDSWPEKGGSFTPEDNVALNVELKEPASGSRIATSQYNVTFVSLIDARTREIVTLNETPSLDGNLEGGYRYQVSFPAAGLSEGEYEAALNITYSGESRIWKAWFRISGYEVFLQTVPPEYQPWDHPFPTNQNITFNITVVPVPADVSGGTLYIKDNRKNWEDAITPVPFNLTNGTALVNVSLAEASDYTAVAQVGSAERHWWFRTGAFKLRIIHEDPATSHDIKADGNVTLVFEVLNRTDGAEWASTAVNVTRLMSPRDWSELDTNLYSNGSVPLDGSGKGQFSFDPNASGDLPGGEYEVEMVFTVDGKDQTEYFWFQVKTLYFEAWHDQSFLPGQEIAISVILKDPTTGAGLAGRNITVEEVHSRERGHVSNYNASTGTTDGTGQATISLNISADISGEVDVRLKEDGENQIRWVGFTINGYELRLERNWEKWSFSTDEAYTADLYVTDPDGSPVAGKSVNIKVTKEGEWGSPCLVDSMSATDASGHSTIAFNISNLTSGMGHYRLEVLVDDSARIEDWFKVETFHVDAWAQGSSSGRHEITPDETVRVMVKAEEIGTGTPIQGANVELLELRKVPQWEVVAFPNITQNNQTTDSTGFAELGFRPPQTEQEYVVRINITANVSGTVTENIADTWFRITSGLISVELLCPMIDGNVSDCRDRYTRLAGEPVSINISGTGMIKAELREIKDFWRDTRIEYSGIYNESENGTILTFDAPDQEGEYEAIFDIHVNSTHRGEERIWFKVVPSVGLMAHTWVEPQNVWAGKNATIAIFTEKVEHWEPVICEQGSNFTITELKDAWNWTTVADGGSIDQWVELAGESGPPEARVNFAVPNLTQGREYAAFVNVTCVVNGQAYQLGLREAWFRIAAFQVSSLMDEFVKANQSVEYWIKVTDAEGVPVANATVYKEELIGGWNWEVIQTYNDSTQTDANGEVTGSITTPPYPGEFELRMKIENGSLTQEVFRWFRIEPMKLKIQLDKSKFFDDEDVNITINVTDAMTDQPVQNADVHFRIFPMMEKGEGGPGPPPGEAHFPEQQTDENGTVTFTMPAANTSVNEYMANADVCKDEKGCVWNEKMFNVRNFNTSVDVGREFQPGDNMSVNITVLNRTGQALAGGKIMAALLKMSDKPDEEPEALSNVGGTLDGSGTAPLVLPVPGNASGLTVLYIEINDSADNMTDFETYLVVVHQVGVQINVSAPPNASASQFMDVNISTNDTTLALAPFMPHVERIDSGIPLSKMMGGKMSGSWYEAPIYLKPDGTAHMKILSQRQPGSYAGVFMFIKKDSSWFGPEDMVDIMFKDYEVF